MKRLLRQYLLARMSGKSGLTHWTGFSILGVVGRRRIASTRPDSLIPSRIAALSTRYVIQMLRAAPSTDIARKKIVARVSSAFSALMSMFIVSLQSSDCSKAAA